MESVHRLDHQWTIGRRVRRLVYRHAMDDYTLPEIGVATAFIAYPSCAICEQPFAHESDRGIPWPGAFVEATINNPQQFAVPVCDKCVQAHYPAKVAEVEAQRLHYWTH